MSLYRYSRVNHGDVLHNHPNGNPSLYTVRSRARGTAPVKQAVLSRDQPSHHSVLYNYASAATARWHGVVCRNVGKKLGTAGTRRNTHTITCRQPRPPGETKTK